MLYIIIAVLLVVITALVIKVFLLKKGYGELTDDLEEQVRGETNVPVTLTTKDKDARACADTINRELQKLRDERMIYEQGNRKIKDAVTGISHDLRTPLTAINSYLDLIDTEEDEQKKKVYLERIKNRTDVLSSLTDELFRYTTSTDRVEKHESPKVEKTDIKRVLEECLLSFYAAFKERDIEPEIDMPEEPVYVLCEKRSADRILENLINNALKYSAGDLKVTMDKDGRTIFRNCAPELTPVSVSKLFDKYYTVNEAEGSTGLGFSIARELMEKNGGSIEAAISGTDLIITLTFIKER